MRLLDERLHFLLARAEAVRSTLDEIGALESETGAHGLRQAQIEAAQAYDARRRDLLESSASLLDAKIAELAGRRIDISEFRALLERRIAQARRTLDEDQDRIRRESARLRFARRRHAEQSDLMSAAVERARRGQEAALGDLRAALSELLARIERAALRLGPGPPETGAPIGTIFEAIAAFRAACHPAVDLHAIDAGMPSRGDLPESRSYPTKLAGDFLEDIALGLDRLARRPSSAPEADPLPEALRRPSADALRDFDGLRGNAVSVLDAALALPAPEARRLRTLVAEFDTRLDAMCRRLLLHDLPAGTGTTATPDPAIDAREATLAGRSAGSARWARDCLRMLSGLDTVESTELPGSVRAKLESLESRCTTRVVGEETPAGLFVHHGTHPVVEALRPMFRSLVMDSDALLTLAESLRAALAAREAGPESAPGDDGAAPPASRPAAATASRPARIDIRNWYVAEAKLEDLHRLATHLAAAAESAGPDSFGDLKARREAADRGVADLRTETATLRARAVATLAGIRADAVKLETGLSDLRTLALAIRIVVGRR